MTTRKPKKQKRSRALGSRDATTKEGWPYSPWPAPLLPQHALFLDFYMRHFNGTRAAKEAGFSTGSAHDQAHRILNRHEVRAEIFRRRKSLADQKLGGIDEETYQREIARVAFANMADFAPMYGDGDIPEKLAMLGADQSAAVQEITVEEFRDGRTRGRQVRRTKFKLGGKNAALELYGRARGWITDEVDHTVTHQGTVMFALMQQVSSGEEGRPIIDVQPIINGDD